MFNCYVELPEGSYSVADLIFLVGNTSNPCQESTSPARKMKRLKNHSQIVQMEPALFIHCPHDPHDAKCTLEGCWRSSGTACLSHLYPEFKVFHFADDGLSTACETGRLRNDGPGAASRRKGLMAFTQSLEYYIYTGWWFGTCFFPSIGNFIIPVDELIFFRGVGIPTTKQ